MSRIFLTLSLVAMLLLVTNLVIGLMGDDYNELSLQLRETRLALARATARGETGRIEVLESKADDAYAQLKPAQGQVRLHILIGILAALITVLVQSIGVTYFIGTGRWCKEVTVAYELDASFNRRFNAVKRRSFPWALLGMAMVLTIAAMGAAADPGTLRDTTHHWVKPHYWAAMLGTVVIGACMMMQYETICRNQELIREVVSQVSDERSRRGLE